MRLTKFLSPVIAAAIVLGGAGAAMAAEGGTKARVTQEQKAQKIAEHKAQLEAKKAQRAAERKAQLEAKKAQRAAERKAQAEAKKAPAKAKKGSN